MCKLIYGFCVLVNEFTFCLKVCIVEPGHYKDVESLVNKETKGNATIEVQSFRVRED